jgi:hypothetical protein
LEFENGVQKEDKNLGFGFITEYFAEGDAVCQPNTQNGTTGATRSTRHFEKNFGTTAIKIPTTAALLILEIIPNRFFSVCRVDVLW